MYGKEMSGADPASGGPNYTRTPQERDETGGQDIIPKNGYTWGKRSIFESSVHFYGGGSNEMACQGTKLTNRLGGSPDATKRIDSTLDAKAGKMYIGLVRKTGGGTGREVLVN